MTQDHDRMLIQAFLDGELDAAGALAFEQRLRSEPALAEEHAFFAAAKAASARLPPIYVSEAFGARIAALAPPAPVAESRIFPQSISRRQFAASLLVTAVASSGAGFLLRSGTTEVSEADMIASSHRRGLLAASPIDIASSDRHTVKPWFDAHLGLSPPVVDLGGKGFTLLGGRVDVIGSTALPTLVYRYREHLISLFAVPVRPEQPGTEAPHRLSAGGLQMIRWTQNGLAYWAVSDAEWSVLEQFATGFREQTGDPKPSG